MIKSHQKLIFSKIVVLEEKVYGYDSGFVIGVSSIFWNLIQKGCLSASSAEMRYSGLDFNICLSRSKASLSIELCIVLNRVKFIYLLFWQI